MRKAVLLLISIILIATMFTMVSCENNVYLPENDTWSVRDMYFQTFGEALAWLMGQNGGSSRDLVQSDIPESQTIYLMRDVAKSENAGAIEIPASFRGSLCIDFRGHEYWFSSKLEKFFNIQGGDRIDIINGRTVISEDAFSGSKAVIVNVNTVTIDDHLVDDRRPVPQAIEVGPNGVLVIRSSSNNRTNDVLNGAFDIQAGGELRITGGVFRIDSIDNPAAMTGLVITGGVISNPHELSVYVDAAIAVGGHPENVQTIVIHDISDMWITIDPEKHYKTCSGCTHLFEEAPHTFTDWVYDSNFNGRRQCTVCGKEEYMDHVHTLVFHPAKDATCTVPGNIAYYGCEICGRTYLNAEGTVAADDVFIIKPHTPSHTDAVAPTCTVAGNIEYWTCEECHQHFTDAACTTAVTDAALVVPATGHAFDEWAVVTPATCTEAGLERRICANDTSHIEEKPIEALGHQLTAYVAHDATCTAEGNSAYWFCTRCGKYFSDAACTTEIAENSWIIPAIGHSYGEWTVVTPATCTADGLKQRICANDATHIEQEVLPAVGHSWNEAWSSDTTNHWHECDNCDDIKDLAEHTLGTWTYNPETGKMDNECSVCHKDFHQDHVHNENNLTYHPAVPHTCTENGTKGYYECSDCGKKMVAVGSTFAMISDEDLIDPASHSLSKIDAVSATCETDGNTAYWECSVCGKLFSDAAGTTEITLEDSIIPATGHYYGSWIIDTDPTCTEAGSKHRVCANDASHIETEEISALGHSMSALIAEIPASCEEDGTKAHYHCATCDKDFADADGKTELADLTIPATGHVNLTKTDKIDPTCTEAGQEAFWTCDECGQKFSDAEGTTKIANPVAIPALGHTLVAHEAADATCEDDGNTAYWECSVCNKFFADEEGEEEIEEDSWVIDALGHTLVAHEAADATCEDDGNTAYWECTVCGKFFADEDAEEEIEEDSWVIDATGHHTDDDHHVAAVAATCTEAGNIEYWTCKDCGKYFLDEDLTTEKPAEYFVIPALGHAKVHYDAVAATCTATGNVEYWHCSRCEKNFSDADCTTELETVVTPMIAHTPTTHAAVDPTCVEIGNSLYYECTVCGKYFSDEACEHEIEKDSWILAIDPDNHSLEHHEAVAHTCTEDGNVEYWQCSLCGKYFSDEEGTTEITEAQTVDPASHTLTVHEAVDATCTTTGNTAYWECTVCEKFFSDEACEHEIEEDSWITEIDPDNHDIEHVDAVAPTATAHGNIEYWHCTRCDKYFSDEDLEEEIDLEDTVVHNWSEDWTHDVIDNGHYHWHVCTVEGCEGTTDPTACTPVYEHDTEGHSGKHRQVCSTCSAELAEWTDHVWGEEIKHDDGKDLDYVECICGAKLYDELYEVVVGEITSTIGTDSPAGTMLVETEESTVTVSYVPKADEEPELSCRLYIDGVWSGENLEQQQDGTFTFQVQAEKTYRVMLIAENETGMTIYEKIIGL